jgi:hypothetical protein
MEKQDTDQLHEELKPVTALLAQIKSDLDSVKTEVHAIHSQVTDLPTGKQYGEDR